MADDGDDNERPEHPQEVDSSGSGAAPPGSSPSTKSDRESKNDDSKDERHRHVSPDYRDEDVAGGGPRAKRTNIVPQYGKTKESDVVDVTHADRVRKIIVIWLLSLLSGTIVLGIAAVATVKWTGAATSDVRSIFEIMFSAVVTLVSTAVGFYFATEARKQGPPKG